MLVDEIELATTLVPHVGDPLGLRVLHGVGERQHLHAVWHPPCKIRVMIDLSYTYV